MKHEGVPKYILDKHGKPVRCKNLLTWAMAYEESNRRVAETKVGKVMVSTIFLGLDHNFSGKGPPILWETMIFGGKHDRQMWRYRSKAKALAHHKKIVAMIHAEDDLELSLTE